MIIPLRTDSPLRSTPYMNWGLITANLAVFFLTLSNPHAADNFGLSPRQPLLYQFFSYQFIHSGWMHIAGNMLFLYIFGNNVNDRLGHVGYLALYLAGGVFAGISYVITSSGVSQMVGASGSIAAVTGAFLVLLPRSNVTILYYWLLIGMTEISSVWLIVGYFLLDIFLNLTSSDSVAHMAHVGGTLFGFVACCGLLMFHLLPRDPFDVVAMVQRWNRRRQYRDMVAGGYNPFDYTAPDRIVRGGGGASAAKPPPPPDPLTSRALEIRSAIGEALASHDLDLATQRYLELRAINPGQVLSRQPQLDIANHLAAQHLHEMAAEAYEAFLRQYPKADQTAQVELMLGLIYARYLNRPDTARDFLTRAAAKYHDGRELLLAREELSRLGPPAAG